MEKDLKYYCNVFGKLRRDYKNGGAPHKPILLISLIQAFQQGICKTNQIRIIPELVGLFKSNWTCLVQTNHTCLFTLPFYHLNSEPFWTLVANPGCELWVKSKSSMRSLSNLTTAIKYALVDFELVRVLCNKEDSDVLLFSLLDMYFPETKSNFHFGKDAYIREIQSQIVNESQTDYKKRIIKIKQDLDLEQFQEEIYIRSNIFKREIPKIYNNTCCISGMRVDAIENVSMIDACHIIPFSESYNDTISNGIALCPNLHRAFDRGLFAISNDYFVQINNIFNEPNMSIYNLKQFDGVRILLPENPEYHPSIDAFCNHRRRFNIG